MEALAAEARGAAGGDSPLAQMLGSAVRAFAQHRDTVARWGRFPHRNEILGRANTPEEDRAFAEGSIPSW